MTLAARGGGGSPVGASRTDRLTAWLDERTRIGAVLRGLKERVFPDHWSLRLGQIAVSAFVIVLLTGVVLLFVYTPSTTPVIYDGAYAPLRGVEMSRALESTLDISFEVPGGLIVRQLHNWASSVMIGALMLHILRIFFTGAFRKPREVGWVLLLLVLFASMAAGLTGSVLPDDLLSGSSLAVLDGILKAIPFVGAQLSDLVFQGSFPSGAIVTFYPLHIVLLPALILGLLAVVGVLALVHRPAQYPGPGRTEDNVVGSRLPVAAAKALGLFAVVFGVLTLVAATVTVNPVWHYGPADPANASAGSGAVWYLAFLDGAQRLVPPGWEFEWLGFTWTLAILVPVGIVTLFFVATLVYPFFEGWVTGDRRSHHLLERPRNAPTRTAIGAAGVTFFGVLWIAGGSDVIASNLRLTIEGVTLTLQLALLLGPAFAFFLAKRICLGLQRKDRELALHGYETGRIVRLPGGEYTEVHGALDPYQRWRLVGREVYEPYQLRPRPDGRIRVSDRARAAVSHWFFKDDVRPPTKRELEVR